MTRPLLQRISIIILLLMLGACATPPKTDLNTEKMLAEAAARLQDGDNQGAVNIYAELARNASQPQRDQYQLLAMEAALTPDLLEVARQYLEVLDDQHLNLEEQGRKRLARAQIELLSSNPGKAQDALAFPVDKLSPELQLRFLSTQAQVYLASGLNLEAIRAYIDLDSIINEEAQRAQNMQDLWSALNQTPHSDLFNWSQNTLDPVMKGWLELAYIAKTTPIQGGALDAQLEAWQQVYAEHPANPVMIDQLRSEWAELQTYPTNIAVLLPMSGRIAPVSQAVADGILASYFQTQSTLGLAQPQIRFYDTARTDISIQALYELAVEEGAEFVIGPLNKDKVETLANTTDLTVPVLALNTMGAELTPPEMLYQFGLSPEDEARQAAERASIDGYEFGIVYAPKNDWGERIVESFTLRYEELSGTVLAKGMFDAKANDYSSTIKKTLNLDQSELRARQVQATIRQNVKSEPRRRQDAQFVFIAATPRQARLLKPQLKYHRSGDLPVYATSHLFSGQVDKKADRDLNGITYSEIPWLITSANPEADLKAMLERVDTEAVSKYPRLVALGIDSYKLIPYLPRLSSRSYERYEGVTGNLSVDENRILHRQLKWATFSKGQPKPVSTEPSVEN
jgi:outer membrane PBP1 activator LpoA protein